MDQWDVMKRARTLVETTYTDSNGDVIRRSVEHHLNVPHGLGMDTNTRTGKLTPLWFWMGKPVKTGSEFRKLANLPQLSY